VFVSSGGGSVAVGCGGGGSVVAIGAVGGGVVSAGGIVTIPVGVDKSDVDVEEGPVVDGIDVDWDPGGLSVLIAVRKTGVMGVPVVIGVPPVMGTRGQACKATG